MTTPENPYNGNPYTPGTGQPADETQQFGQPAQQPYGAPQDEPMQAMPEYGQMQPNPYAAPEQPMQSFDYSQQGQQSYGGQIPPQIPPQEPMVGYGAQQNNDKWNGLVIAGFVCAFLVPIVGLILSIIGMVQINKNGGKSKGMAIAGIIVSVVVMVLNGLLVASAVGTVIEKHVLASDGRNYRITATYGPEAGVPEDAQLKVSEILPPESDETIAGSEEPLDSSLYDEYVARTEDALGWAEGSASYVRLFDIKITDEYGNKIDIAAPVDVRIELADKDSSEEGLLGTQVVHFADGAEVPDVVQNLSFDETKTESEGMTLSFTAAGFSVYAIVDAPEPAVVEIDYVDSLEELAGQTGKEFYLSYGTPPKYFTNELNTNSAFIENTSSGQADGWYFEPTGVDNQYYIYTYVEGVKKYITNPSGNLAGLADTNGTKFDLEDAGNGKFYFKKAGASLWLQHSGSGSGIRFYTDNKNAANSQISIAYASSFVLPDDPYGLNGKTYGIAYHNDTATSAALTAEGVTTSGQQRLKGLDMLMRPDVLDHDGILLVAENSDIQEWTFQNVSEDKYYLKTTVDGVTKYLTINGNNVTLMDTPDETYSLIKAIPGTGANSGKWHFSVGNYSLNFNNTANNGFNGTTGTGATTWMNLVEKSSFPEEDFTYYNAKKVSVSDTSQVPDKKQVIIYTRVWNDTKKKYEFFAIDHDGSLIPCYDTGDGIEWIGTNVNTALWELTEGTNPDGSLSYYYWLRNTQYGNTFITPQLSNDQVIYTSPGSDVQDLNASVNLNGRRYEENYTTIIRWDDDQYGYSGLKVENGHLVPCALSEAEDFYFAIMEEKQHAEDVTTVETVDSKAYGITMKMVDFNNDVQKYSTGDRDVVQTKVMGTPDGGAGLLSTCLDPVTGYPVVKSKSNSNSLSQLFDSTKEMDANHLFLQNIYNESGYFEYDSTQNFAHLNPDGTFTVYDQLGAITGDAEHKTTREHGQFMPYNDISPAKGYAYDKDGHIITNQTDVLAHELPDTNARKGENLYLIGNNKKGMRDTTGDGVDYFFGMELEASFTQTANGLDAWGHDIIFEFSGDDDFWLYVDGQLVLDLGGVHSAQVGSVNFRTGLITSSNGNSTLYNTFKNNYKDQHPEATDEEVNQYLDDIFERNEEGNYVFKDYTKHTMRMFYMERGAGASNLHMRFNLAAVKPGTVVLSKQLSGTNSGSNSLLEYPYQIYYTIRGDGESEEHLLNDPSKVTYKDSTKQVKYEEQLMLENQTYNNVFFLKAGESAVIELPEDTVNYRIVECGISTATYDVVKANGETLAPTDTQNPGRKDYKTSLDTMTNRDTVLFDNHVKEGAMRTLSITKQLYDSNGQDRLHYDAAEGEKEDKTLFSYRLYLGNAFTSEDDIPPANLYSYFVKNRDKYYCRWDLAQKKFVSLGINNYSDLETYLAPMTDTQKESIIFKTSPSGAISKIPADYTVEVRDLIDGVHWKVEERDDEIPKGYTLRLSDGYTRTDIIPEAPHGTTPISDTIEGEVDPEVDVRNQKGWGLTVQKVWTDEDFIDHDPIYFAVYYEKEGQAPELIEGSVRSMMNGNKEIYYFFNQEQMAGRDFSEYRVYEVKLTNPEIDPATGEIRYDSITPIPDSGKLTVGGTPKGTTVHQENEYTVTYQIGEPTTQNENVRTDVVTNSRPGIKLFKMRWDYETPLAGAVFTLKDSEGQDVAAESYTSRSEDGLITIAYLNPGIYTLTEVETPKGYVVLPEPITITVSDDSITVGPEELKNKYYIFEPAKEATETQEADMATVTIRDRETELHVKKVDAVTKDPLAGAHFALYNQVTDAQGNKRKDYQPITGYENLISNAEGILTFPDTNVEAVTIENLTWGNTYYLTETQAVTDYDLLKEDLCFTVNKDGTITIENAEHSGWLTTSTDTDKGKYSSLIQIPNGKLQYVSVWKTDDGYTTITTGASFALYKAEDYDDAAGRPKEGAVPVLTGTTGANGILALGTLPAGTEYRLVETKAPDGYYPPTSAIKIFVNADKVTAMQAGSPAEVSRKGDEHWVPDQPEATWQIRVWNSQGYALPSTGGSGTALFYLLGGILLSGAGILLLTRLRMKRKHSER